MKKLALLGSTGSIGTQALDVVRCIQKEGDGAVEVTAARSADPGIQTASSCGF